MSVVWTLALMFVSWLIITFYRAWRQLKLEGRRKMQNRLVILLKDQADQVEWFIHRVLAKKVHRPEMQVALVDGGSADETAIILEKMARRYNLALRKNFGFENPCQRRVDSCCAKRELNCASASCFVEENCLGPALCLDLRAASASDLCNLTIFNF